jgi:quercetin dioxygenase-like cupin family protein
VSMRTLTVVVVLLLAGRGAAVAADAKGVVFWPAGDIKWTDSPGVPGAKVAVLWGDPKAGTYGALKSVPGGSLLPLHTHTNDHKVVMVGGTMSISVDGAAPKDTPAGSYVFIPGGVKHKAECRAGATCTYLEQSPGAYDIQVLEEKK